MSYDPQPGDRVTVRTRLTNDDCNTTPTGDVFTGTFNQPTSGTWTVTDDHGVVLAELKAVLYTAHRNSSAVVSGSVGGRMGAWEVSPAADDLTDDEYLDRRGGAW